MRSRRAFTSANAHRPGVDHVHVSHPGEGNVLGLVAESVCAFGRSAR